ncbi:MAG: LysR family transcriptional regulator [Rhodospirillales bacterium]|nr:LysR family transcriptional regulator [Rhodospirillales bacterium]
MKTLIAIAEHRSFAAAAEAIGLTQSAVSLHVKALEVLLQTRLFDRSTRPALMNAHGRTLVEKAREIVQLSDGLTATLATAEIAGHLELGAVPTALTGVLASALVRLNTTQPKLLIRVTSGLSAELAEAVRKGRLDVAVVSEPTDLNAGLSWHACGSEPLMVIAPGGTPGNTDKDLLEALPFIRFKRFAWAGRLIDAHIRERGIRTVPGMEIDSLEAVALMVASGLGVSVVPKRPIREPFPPDLRVLAFGDPPVQRTIGLVERTQNPKSELVRLLYGEMLSLYA